MIFFPSICLPSCVNSVLCSAGNTTAVSSVRSLRWVWRRRERRWAMKLFSLTICKFGRRISISVGFFDGFEAFNAPLRNIINVKLAAFENTFPQGPPQNAGWRVNEYKGDVFLHWMNLNYYYYYSVTDTHQHTHINLHKTVVEFLSWRAFSLELSCYVWTLGSGIPYDRRKEKERERETVN